MAAHLAAQPPTRTGRVVRLRERQTHQPPQRVPERHRLSDHRRLAGARAPQHMRPGGAQQVGAPVAALLADIPIGLDQFGPCA